MFLATILFFLITMHTRIYIVHVDRDFDVYLDYPMLYCSLICCTLCTCKRHTQSWVENKGIIP